MSEDIFMSKFSYKRLLKPLSFYCTTTNILKQVQFLCSLLASPLTAMYMKFTIRVDENESFV